MNLPEIQAMRDQGYDIVSNPYKRRMTEQEIGELLASGFDGVLAGVEPITAAVIKKAKGLKVISRCGTGLDNVDISAAVSHGISVFNTPDAPAPAVAELTIGLMLDALRGISLQDRAVRQGKWERPMGRLLAQKTVGVIGYGRIGQRVAQLVSAFDAKVIVYDLLAPAQKDHPSVSLDQLLEQTDIVSLHVPYSEVNRHMIDSKAFAKMKKGAILVNTARGGLVDENALKDALEERHLAAAALDVFEEEPYTGPLKGIENIVLSAHTGSYAAEARIEQERMAAENLLQGLLGLAEGNVNAAE